MPYTFNPFTGTMDFYASGGGLTVGTTAISGGSSGRVLYNNGGTLGEYAVTGSAGSVVLSTSPTFSTSIIGAAGLTIDLATANLWSQRNSTNAQTFRVYNTYTDASNGEWFSIGWSGNIVTLQPTKNGTGTQRNAKYNFDATNYIGLSTTNTILLAAAGSGNAWEFAASTLSIGNWSGSSAKTIGLKNNAGNTNRASDYIQIDADGGTGSGAAGYLVVRSAVAGSSGTTAHTLEETLRSYLVTTAQPMVSLGGATSSFPALRRVSTALDARLADDSAYAGFQSLYERFGSGTPEGSVSAPVGAVYHRTDGGASTSFYVKESGVGNTGWVAK